MGIINNKNDYDKMRESCRIVGKVHSELKKIIKPGIKLKELDKIANKIIHDEGAIPSFLGYHGFPATICSSVNNVLVHGIPNEYELKEGDLISIDVGAFKNGFHGDAAFTVIVGKATKEAENISKATKEALRKAIEISKPGTTIGDIGAIIEETAKKYGVMITRDYTGHGIGKELHEMPYIPNYGNKGMGDKLVEGMCIAIEPMFIIDTEETWVDPLDNWTVRSKNGKLTSHDEHTIIITKKGSEILTIE